MSTVFRGGNWKITMYFRDHPPPHVHIVTSSKQEAQLRLSDFSVLAGHVPPPVLSKARAWTAANSDQLREKWNALHPD
jgi:hypothetical protein